MVNTVRKIVQSADGRVPLTNIRTQARALAVTRNVDQEGLGVAPLAVMISTV